MKVTVIICMLSLASSTAKKLPPNIRRCDAKSSDFKKCFAGTMHDAVREMSQPFPSLGMPGVDPLVVPEISITPGGGLVNFLQNYTNVRLTGLKNASCLDADVNFEKKKVYTDYLTPRFEMKSNYYFNGTVAILPIYGNGISTILLDNVRCAHHFDIEERYKRGKKYFRAVDSTFDLRPENINFNFENLYDGSQLLSDSVNRFMNENWKEIYNNVKPLYEEAYAIIFQDIMNRFLSRVPVSELFINAD